MTTPTEAMRQALDALEMNTREWKALADSGDSGFWIAEEQDFFKQTDAAITALRDALSAAPQPPAAQQGEATTTVPAPAKCLSAEPEALRPDDKCPEMLCGVIGQCQIVYCAKKAAAAPQPVAQGDVPPVLVRDLAEIIGVGVPSVCAALLEIGRPPRSTNMAIGGEEAVAVAKRLAAAPAGVVGEPVDRSSKASRVHALVDAGPYPGMSEAFDAHMGAPCWTDPDYAPDASTWAAAWKAALRTAPPARQALTDEQIDKIIADCNDFLYQQDMHPRRERAIARAIERAHGIGGKGGAA